MIPKYSEVGKLVGNFRDGGLPRWKLLGMEIFLGENFWGGKLPGWKERERTTSESLCNPESTTKMWIEDSVG